MTSFEDIGRLPAPGDHVAIATGRLEAGLVITFDGHTFSLSHTVLEGHRFAVRFIPAGERLTSWGMAFGTAIRDIRPGDYICNAGVLEALRGRSIDFPLPASPNFSDDIPAFDFKAYTFSPAEQVSRSPESLFFDGFARNAARGVGTRNFIVVIGMSSRVGGFARRLAQACRDSVEDLENVDGVVPVAHTEGDDRVQLNKTLVLRTLAGFLVHPNVCAALVVDHEGASVTGKDLQAFMAANAYPAADVIHDYMTLDGGFAECLDKGQAMIAGWLGAANQCRRSRQPLSQLKIALQCGGSDAFSGISGNPLAGWVAKAVIAQGGGANLAETDELIGAEAYVLKKVRSESVARKFLSFIERFQGRAARHGSSAAGNPSGGNKFRGLYNIYLKSLGAAMKRDPDVRLDAVIDYGERMVTPGYYFMDSPGNDLESIAGQVASGCNIIFFVTGNGSITNFPFVPTIKIVTTSARYALLADDMDVNAGAYLDGVSMDDLGRQMLEDTIAVASGRRSTGERAGHAQVQLWRNWRLRDGEQPGSDPGAKEYAGIPLDLSAAVGKDNSRGNGRHARSLAPGKPGGIGLVLPTSLCSGQIGNMAARQLNASDIVRGGSLDACVSLVHTEGCGASSGASEDLFLRTMCGHLLHPAVQYAVLLEHGCEKTHNDYFRNYLEREGVDTTRFGWASIQQDGGIERAIDKIENWFLEKTKHTGPDDSTGRRVEGPVVGLIVDGAMPAPAVEVAFATLARRAIAHAGASVLPVTEQPAASEADPYQGVYGQLGIERGTPATLNYAQPVRRSGLQLMAAPSLQLQELITGLGACGADVIIVASDDYAVPAHPFIPTLQVGSEPTPQVDLGGEALTSEALIELTGLALQGGYIPKSRLNEHFDFQISRGWRGVSL